MIGGEVIRTLGEFAPATEQGNLYRDITNHRLQELPTVLSVSSEAVIRGLGEPNVDVAQLSFESCQRVMMTGLVLRSLVM